MILKHQLGVLAEQFERSHPKGHQLQFHSGERVVRELDLILELLLVELLLMLERV
jgi:hypothetical protein